MLNKNISKDKVIACSITIFGDVQGVFFRKLSKEKAKEFNITGFVRNLDDKTVYIECEGKRDALNKFITWCKHGPDFANVTDVRIANIPMKNFRDFSVVY